MSERESGDNRNYILVHRIDSDARLDTHIPLHMTALHWFEMDVKAEEGLVRDVQEFAQSQQVLHTRATEEAIFGPDNKGNDVPVMRLERTPELVRLHVGLIALVKSYGGLFDERWTGSELWNPHVTHQPEGRLQVGDEVEIDSLDLITKAGDGTCRLVTRTMLGGRDD